MQILKAVARISGWRADSSPSKNLVNRWRAWESMLCVNSGYTSRPHSCLLSRLQVYVALTLNEVHPLGNPSLIPALSSSTSVEQGGIVYPVLQQVVRTRLIERTRFQRLFLPRYYCYIWMNYTYSVSFWKFWTRANQSVVLTRPPTTSAKVSLNIPIRSLVANATGPPASCFFINSPIRRIAELG